MRKLLSSTEVTEVVFLQHLSSLLSPSSPSDRGKYSFSRPRRTAAAVDRSTLESGVIHFDIDRPIPCAFIPASGQQVRNITITYVGRVAGFQETPHLCAGGASAVAVVATRQEWDHQEASGLPEHILELSQEFAAQSGKDFGEGVRRGRPTVRPNSAW